MNKSINKKKILFIAHVQSHIMNFHIPFINCFINKGYEVYVATKLDSKKYDCSDNKYNSINWIDIDIPRNPFSLDIRNALKDLINLMKQNDFTLIHVHTPVGAFLGRLANKLTNSKPILYTAHGFHFYKGAPKSYWLIYFIAEKIASKWTNGLITINNEDFEIAERHFKTNKCKIYKVNGVGVDLKKYKSYEDMDFEFKMSLGLQKNDFVLTIVAELIERKNHLQLIRAIKNINKEVPNMKILFVGDGKLKNSLEKEIIDSKLNNIIKLLGYRSDVEKIINISDIIGLFSIHEGLPKNILEAMAINKPVICTDVRGSRDLISDEVNGYLVPLGNIFETEKKLINIYNNREKLRKLGMANNKIIDKYSLDRIIEEMNDIYEEIMNINGGD